MPLNIDINSLLQQPELTALLRIVVAGLIGALIGLERELAGKAAGIRTYGLVAVGSAMFTVVAIYGFGTPDYASRIVGSIITGIGFLGAGTILHTKLNVVGLTTAAGMWVAAGVGMAIGSGMYMVGIGAGVTLFILLQFAGPEEFIRSSRRRAGKLDAAEMDAIAEEELEERLKRTPRTFNAPPAQPPITAWPPPMPTPAYGPWSTTSQAQGQAERR